MRLHPGCDFAEIVFYSTRVEQVAGGVAKVQRAIDIVSRSLQHADAIVELLRYTILLVARNVILSRVRRVVGGYLSDIGVLAGAEFEVVVARLSV